MKKRLFVNAVFSTLFLVGCGGGGGGSSSTSTTTGTTGTTDTSSPAATTTTLSGVVIDGYWRGAKVCIDRNQNALCDSDEPSATTESGGKYTVTVLETDVGSYPLVAAGTTATFDEGTNAYLSGNITLLSPAQMQNIITPITTMVQTEIQYNNKSIDTAKATVAAALGITTDDIGLDYVANANTTLENKATGIANELKNTNNDYTQVAQEQGITVSSDSNTTDNNTTDNNATLSIVSTYPEANATDVPPFTFVDINFSTTVDSSALNTSDITISGGKSCKELDIDDNTARCWVYNGQLGDAFSENTAYTIEISDANYTFSFTTGKANVLPRLRTGQTTSYADYDDGWYVAQGLGLERNFSRDDTNNIVTDNVTGFMWQDTLTSGVHAADLNSTCKSLNLGQYSNWISPSIEELFSIVDIPVINPSIFPAFQNTETASYRFYWTSTPYARISSMTWALSFMSANDNTYYDQLNYYKCLIKSNNYSSHYEKINSDSIVIDTNSGLIWEDNNHTSDTKIDWNSAISYCENLQQGGYEDWRMPNINELYMLADRTKYSPAIPTQFSNAASYDYWSSSDTSESTATVYFDYGKKSSLDKRATAYVRCVRGGVN